MVNTSAILEQTNEELNSTKEVEDVSIDIASNASLGSELDPESDILAPIQAQIKEQLIKELGEVSISFEENKNETIILNKRKEESGVQLYNAQQHLAKLQEDLEKTQDQYTSLQQLHEDKQARYEELKNEYLQTSEKVNALNTKLKSYQTERDKLNSTMMTLNQYNKDTLSAIQIEQKAAYKTESDISKLESDLHRQDLLIVSLTDQIEAFKDTIAETQEQIVTQQKERGRAQEVIKESQAEIQAISSNKKELLQQWQSSLRGLEKREEALCAAREALDALDEEIVATTKELQGYKHSVSAILKQNEVLHSSLSKLSCEVEVKERQVEALVEKRDSATLEYNEKKSILDDAINENKAMELEIKQQLEELKKLQTKEIKIKEKIQEQEKHRLNVLAEQSNNKKHVQSILKEIEKKQSQIATKESLLVQLEHDITSVRVEILQSEDTYQKLETTLNELNIRIKQKEETIAQLETRNRNKNEEIETKQKQLSFLNNKYHQILVKKGLSDEVLNTKSGKIVNMDHTGELEATVNNLAKQITQKQNENMFLQREWVKRQQEIINMQSGNIAAEAELAEHQAHQTILKQKRNQLENATRGLETEINSANKQSELLYKLMQQVGSKMHAQKNQMEEVESNQFIVEKEMLNKIKEAKEEAMEMELKIQELRQKKRDVLNEILKYEQEIMGWEKKLKIAKEIEETIDPTIGKSEIENMKKEIYVMEQRLAILEQEQKSKIEGMKKIINHRAILQSKSNTVHNSIKHKQTTRSTITDTVANVPCSKYTRRMVVKASQKLALELTRKKEEARAKEEQIKSCLASTDRITKRIHEIKQEINQLGQDSHAISEDLQQVQFQAKHLSHIQEDKKNIIDMIQTHSTEAMAALVQNLDVNKIEKQKERMLCYLTELTELYPEEKGKINELISLL